MNDAVDESTESTPAYKMMIRCSGCGHEYEMDFLFCGCPICNRKIIRSGSQELEK